MAGISEAHVELLHMAIAGNVDDGKSTLIGRLFFDARLIYEDQLQSIIKSSATHNFDGIDLSLLTDGLAAEREQKITIDVAYRYLATAKRRFIIADVPGHEQYTRNMVTGTYKSNVVLLLIDIRRGLTVQFKRHLFIASLLGAAHILVVVNKMDLVDYRMDVFEELTRECSRFAAKLNIHDLQYIPISALEGDMVVHRGSHLDWYDGATVKSYLEKLEISGDRNLIDMRFPVQLVVRPDQGFRGYAGQITSGVIRKGDEVQIFPSGQKTRISSILTYEGEVSYAFCPQSVMLTLQDELDVTRGDMITRENNVPEVWDEIDAIMLWMSPRPLRPDVRYLVRHTTRMVHARVSSILYRINIEDLHREHSQSLELNDIGRVLFHTASPLFCDLYQKNEGTGSFIVIDEETNGTVGVGIIKSGTNRGLEQKTVRGTAQRHAAARADEDALFSIHVRKEPKPDGGAHGVDINKTYRVEVEKAGDAEGELADQVLNCVREYLDKLEEEGS